MSEVVLQVEPDGSPAFSLEAELTGEAFTLSFAWNTRLEAWTMAIADASGDTIVEGVRVVTDWGLLDRFVDDRLPPGQLLTVDLSGTGAPPGLDDFGSRVLLVYNDDDV